MILITLLLSLAILSIIEKQINNKGILNLISYVIISVAFSISYFNGVDWPSYEQIYNHINSKSPSSFEYEPVFLLLFKILNGVGFDFEGAIIFYFIALSGGLLMLASRLKVPLSWLGFIFLVFFYFDLLADQIRQAFSVMLLLHALLSLISRRIIGFIVFSFLSIGFHYASVIIIAYASISKILYLNNHYKYLSLSIFISFVILIGVPIILGDMDFYLRLVFPDEISTFRLLGNLLNEFNESDATQRFGVFFIFSSVFIFLSLFRLNRISNHKELLVFGGILIGSCLQISFYQYPFLQRITQYFFIFPVLLLSFHYKDGAIIRKNLDTLYAVTCFVFGLMIFVKGFSNDIRRDLLLNPKIYTAEGASGANMIST